MNGPAFIYIVLIVAKLFQLSIANFQRSKRAQIDAEFWSQNQNKTKHGAALSCDMRFAAGSRRLKKTLETFATQHRFIYIFECCIIFLLSYLNETNQIDKACFISNALISSTVHFGMANFACHFQYEVKTENYVLTVSQR